MSPLLRAWVSTVVPDLRGSVENGRVAVVGGGITGLAATWELHRQGVDVTLHEAGDRVGGKVRTTELAGERVDEGADAFLARVPHATDLCAELGLSDQLVAPATGKAYILGYGQLRPIPAGAVLGVPTDLEALGRSGLVSPEGVERARDDLTLPDNRPEGPESVGHLIRRRLGDEVLDHLVGPLLAGISAGDPDQLDLATGAAQLAEAAARGPSLIDGLRAGLERREGPVFWGLPTGMGTVVDALADRLAPHIRTNSVITDLADLDADAIVVATPAAATSALLGPLAPETAELVGSIEYASVVLVTFVWPSEAVGRSLDGSGFLVPADNGLLMTACSWASSKWAHLGSGGSTAVFRVSAGRWDDERHLEMTDEGLVARLTHELTSLLDLSGEPDAVRVSHWPASLPQYRPGHGRLVERIDATLAREAPNVRVAGAAYRGLGLPACIAQGRATARAVVGA